MAKLILSVDGTVLKEISLSKERTTLGRKPHNDIQVDNLAVSGEHAAIITILNDSFIEDLNSTNGTLVNGKPIKKHFLQNNDVIEIGKHKLKYFNDTPAQAAGGGAGDFEKTMIIRKPPAAPAGGGAPAPAPVAKPAAPAAPAPAAAAPAPAAAAAPPPPPAPAPAAAPAAAAAPAQDGPARDAAIQVLSGAAAGRTLDLTKNLTTIGKPGVQVAVITRRPTGFFITHVEGATYPTINGSQLGAQAQQLKDHDLIEIAGVKMEFFYKP
ncbi:MAG: FHA domain-containing protein [Betaproteobacteria bacterium]|nr:FHA domain-containing protein [Betaproteobacteria bacterium]